MLISFTMDFLFETIVDAGARTEAFDQLLDRFVSHVCLLPKK